MNFYIDCEFHEYFKQHKFMGFNIGYPTPTIDFISIGIVGDDNRTYYAVCKEFDILEAWNSYELTERIDPKSKCYVKNYWLRNNVLKVIFDDFWNQKGHLSNLHHVSNNFNFRNFWAFVQLYGKTRQQIAKEIIEFVYPLEAWQCLYPGSRIVGNSFNDKYLWTGVAANACYTVHQLLKDSALQLPKPKFYAYFADYDWVTFCQLFGRMINLPKGFPMFCYDLKQMLMDIGNPDITELKKQNKNEHHALHDALHDKRLYEFIMEQKTETNKNNDTGR